mmetsp:Transcript_47624/g.95323  ORF Transcript_47624/g.95323 Transcript_47624/m.95323 type:complete len:229 (-) Transcript_47624:153-839(-)
MARRDLVAAALLSLPLLASAFNAGGILPTLSPKQKLQACNLRAQIHRGGVSSLQAASTSSLKAKAGDKDDFVQSKVPEDATSKCACGSNLSYEKCCGSFHQNGMAPEDPVDLIRARYSAYAYRLPGYIMRTTSRKSPDWTVNQAAWIEDIVDFCDSYRFKRPGGVVLGMELEECTYSSPDVCYVQFKAKLLGPGYRPVELVERSRVLRENGRWFYEKGTLLEYQGDLV